MWSAALLDGLFPQDCELCGVASRNPLPLCHACALELHSNRERCHACALPLPPAPGAELPRRCGACLSRPPPFDSTTAPYLYDAQFAVLVQQWKYRPEPRLGKLLADLWCRAAPPELPAIDLLLPVPLHWRRQLQRGFNQSEQLADLLRSQHPALQGVATARRHLRRRRATATQARLDARARRANLRDAFVLRRPCDTLRIAVIDDVMTTGATAEAVARCLRAGGARAVHLFCLARTPAPPGD